MSITIDSSIVFGEWTLDADFSNRRRRLSSEAVLSNRVTVYTGNSDITFGFGIFSIDSATGEYTSADCGLFYELGGSFAVKVTPEKLTRNLSQVWIAFVYKVWMVQIG